MGKKEKQKEESNVAELDPILSEPPKFACVLLNDDYTPMDFVVEVLQKFFSHSVESATKIMLTVHHQGRGIAGIYSFDIAETKCYQTNEYARSHGYPLKCITEQVN
jgi:ATP-dependent Clp protease adaptor protein ClpS